MERHLAECPGCRDRAGDERVSGDAELLQAVLRVAAEWREKHDSTGLIDRVAEAIRPYLGAQATAALVGAAGPDREKLLTEIEAVLELFLGRRAAASLVTQVLDRSLVRS